jgi:hypothetical protein
VVSFSYNRLNKIIFVVVRANIRGVDELRLFQTEIMKLVDGDGRLLNCSVCHQTERREKGEGRERGG